MASSEFDTSIYTIIKLGGRAAADREQRRRFADDLAALSNVGSLVLVHGGGADVTAVSKRFGIESVFRDGVRVTTDAEMPVVDMVLAGRANKEWVRVLRCAGVNACGISGTDGGLVVGTTEDGSRTAHVSAVDPAILRTLAEAGFVTVVSPVSSDSSGEAVNINADEVAQALAIAVQARTLLYLSDTPGVLREGRVIPRLAPATIEAEISAGTIAGGMIPKVRASAEAVVRGVSTIRIGRFEGRGDLQRLLAGEAGTRIEGEPAGTSRFEA